MKKYEYLVLQYECSKFDSEIIIKDLNKFGENGWKLISTIEKDEYSRSFIFMREKI